MESSFKYHPANAFKFCPFCGGDKFVWDGVKSHKCSTCGKKLYFNPAAATVAIICNEKGELLLIRRKFDPAKGLLDLPGGFVDLGETAEHAVVREVKEELNLEVTSLSFFGSFPNQYLYGEVLYFTLDLTFICKVDDFSTIHAGDDAESYVFLSKEKVEVDQVGLSSIKNVVQEYISKY
ncbi:MAG: NUDIX domain-containing protein [Prevotellaceae bacterium]|jgi:mutator protein MutT|nr:NUDIX domain-containing protein [Prevotellaceae bacterium]